EMPTGGFVGIDLSEEVAVGHFAVRSGVLRGSVLTLGLIDNTGPAMSDVLGIGLLYANWAATLLSDRYPLADDRDIGSVYHAEIAPGERIETTATFMSARGLVPVTRRVFRVNAFGQGALVSAETLPLSGEIGSVHWSF